MRIPAITIRASVDLFCCSKPLSLSPLTMLSGAEIMLSTRFREDLLPAMKASLLERGRDGSRLGRELVLETRERLLLGISIG